MYTNLELSAADVVWSPPELAWLRNLFALVFPPLYFGRPLVLYEEGGPFDPEKGFKILSKYGVTIIVLTPTILRLMMQVEDPTARYDVSDVRVVLSGGEEVGQQLKQWIDDVFGGAAIHEAYGQTEANAIISECSALDVKREDTMGKPVPGQDVTVVGPDTAEPLETPGEVGELAVKYDDNPIYMKEYLNLPEKTDRKMQNGWLLMEDLGHRRRGRLLLVLQSEGRCHHQLRPAARPGGDRGLPGRARGRAQRRGHRGAGRPARRSPGRVR